MSGELFCPTEYNKIANVDFSKTLCLVDNEFNKPLIEGMKRQLAGEKESKGDFNFKI